MRYFCCEKAALKKKFFLDFITTWTLHSKNFVLWLDFDGVLEIQDWMWIANYDSPLRLLPMPKKCPEMNIDLRSSL